MRARARPVVRRAAPLMALTLLAAGVTVLLPAAPAAAEVAPGRTVRVSVSGDGTQAPGSFSSGSGPALSANGRAVAFTTTASLDPLDTANEREDVYVRDRATGRTVLISRGKPDIAEPSAEPPAEVVANGWSDNPSISASGRYVAFETTASNLPDGDRDDVADVVVCDRDPDGDGVFDERKPDGAMDYRYTRIGRPVSPDSARKWRNQHPSIAADASTIAWVRLPTLPDFGSGTAGTGSIVVARLSMDRRGRLTAPAAGEGIEINGSVAFGEGADAGPSPYGGLQLSADGKHVVFVVEYVVPSRSGTAIVVADLAARTATRVDVDSDGQPLPGESSDPTISGDGRVVAFSESPTDRYGTRHVVVVDRDPDGDGVLGPGSGHRVRVTIASRDAGGTVAEGTSPTLSADGRYLAFETTAARMHGGIDNTTGTSPCGMAADYLPQAFTVPLPQGSPTAAPPEMPQAPQQAITCQDIVVRDLVLDRDRKSHDLPRLPGALASPGLHRDCASTVPPGSACEGDGASSAPALSGDGVVVAYFSFADDLVPGDTNGGGDVFVRQFLPSLQASAVAFGTVPLGTSATRTVTVRHAGFGPVAIGSVAVTGPDAANFTVRPVGNCRDAVLYERDSCLLSIRFAPSAGGSSEATLRVDYRGAGAPLTVTLWGGAGPQASGFHASPDPLAFGGTRTALTRSRPGTVTVTNTSLAPFTIRSVARLPGPHLFPGDYRIAANSCSGRVLRPGASCRVSVVNVPHGAGYRPGALEFTDTSGGSPHLVGLAATGTTPTVQASPAVVTAGRVTTISGTGFPTDHPVTVSLPSLAGNATASTVTRHDGSFAVQLPTFPHTAVGTRQVTVTSPGTTLRPRASLLIVLGTLQPPDFTTRR